MFLSLVFCLVINYDVSRKKGYYMNTESVFITVLVITILLIALPIIQKYKKDLKVEMPKSEESIRTQPRYSLRDIDAMEGHRFEYAVADILRGNGYRNVKVTQGSGDYGVDVIATNSQGSKTAIQCKRFQGSVGVKAVQEVYSGMSYYNCSYGMVVTNSTFTKQAVELANKNGIILVDRNGLNKMLHTTDGRTDLETEKLASDFGIPKLSKEDILYREIVSLLFESNIEANVQKYIVLGKEVFTVSPKDRFTIDEAENALSCLDQYVDFEFVMNKNGEELNIFL